MNCPHCHRPLNDTPLPLAHRLNGVHYVGRQVYSVDGKPGLWSAHRDIDEKDTERLYCAIDLERCKGRVRTKTLYRLNELSETMGKIFKETTNGA